MEETAKSIIKRIRALRTDEEILEYEKYLDSISLSAEEQRKLDRSFEIYYFYTAVNSIYALEEKEDEQDKKHNSEA